MPDIWMDVDLGVTVPVNILPLLDDTDFKTRETAVVYNQAGLDLVWNFVTTAGIQTQTAVTPTDTGGNYDWVNVGDGMYNIEIPASGGASINNNTEGFGWFTGMATGVLPWRGPIIGFRAAGLNNALIDSAYSTTRGLAGTALPDAAADAAGGLPISDLGALDLDSQIKTDIDAILVDTGTTLQAEVDGIQADTEDIQSRLPAALVGGRMDSDIGAKTGNVALSAQEKLDVNAEVDTALNTAVPGVPTADSINERMKAIDDKLPSGNLSDLTAAQAADQVWDEAIAGHLGAGSTGLALNGASAPTAATVADAVWDEAVADHLTAGTSGKKVNDIPAGVYKS